MACCVLAGLFIYYLTCIRKKAVSLVRRNAVLAVAVVFLGYVVVFHGEHIAYELGMGGSTADHSHHH